MAKKFRVAVAGATGYSGRELIRILLRHPHFELVAAYASRNTESQPLAGIHPQLSGLTDLPCVPYDEAALAQAAPELVFLATPNEFSHEAAPPLLAQGLKVIDISGAYRLKDATQYDKFYGFSHSFPVELAQAVYGLTEFNRGAVRDAKLIANPGCYVVSILTPMTPLFRAGLVDQSQPLICDSKSGVTGAGKGATATTHFVEVSESLKNYKLFKHQHTPELAQELGLQNNSSQLIFTPHLLPINRGILSTIYVKLKAGVTRQDVLNAWASAFADAPCVRVFGGAQLPEIKFAAHTPFCDIGCQLDETTGQAIIVSAEDNLLKGAASQAIQNANIMFGLAEEAGLL